MIISFGKGGRSGKAAANYMLGTKDHKGMTRAGVQVLRGNPALVGNIADSLSFQKKYSAGIIAWSPKEQPTYEQIQNLLNDFEALAFAGLQKMQYAWAAVKHDDDRDGTHIHFLIACTELNSGNSFNPAPPGWRKAFDSLRDYHNYTHGWASPADIANKRLLSTGRSQGEIAEIKKAITDYLINRIELGLVKDRDDVIRSLLDVGEIATEEKDYISIKPKSLNKVITLKGAIYEQSFSLESLAKIRDAAKTRSSKGGSINERNASEAFNTFQKELIKRAQYNLQRYRKNTIKDMVETLTNRSNVLSEYLSQSLGANALSSKNNINESERDSITELAKATTDRCNTPNSVQPLRTISRIMRKGRRVKTQLQQFLSDIKAAAHKIKIWSKGIYRSTDVQDERLNKDALSDDVDHFEFSYQSEDDVDHLKLNYQSEDDGVETDIPRFK